TGITQQMVDTAPPPGDVLEEFAALLEGRVLVAHNASFDARVLEQAFQRAGLEWPDPPVLCTVALARKCAPLVRQRKLALLADALGIQVDVVHRALPDATTCAQILCALFPRLCAAAPTVADAVAALTSSRRRGRREPAKQAARRAPEDRPDMKHLPKDPGVYVFRDERGRPLYVGKSVSLRTRARAHFCAPSGWTERAEVADYRPTNSELGALVLENRLIKQWRPPGNKALKRTDKWAYVLCRLDVEYPVLEVSAEPASGRAVSIGPVRGKKLAAELADHLTSMYRLRHCGRRMTRREHPSIYGQMGRCCSPCLGDLDPNAYRGQVDKVLALFEHEHGAAEPLLAEIDDRMAAAARERRYERAAALLRRRERLEALLGRLDGVLRAVHADPRLVLARHPVQARFDALWLVNGRVADWGPLPEEPGEVARRSRSVLDAAGRAERTSVPAEDVDEVRIASAWMAEHRPPELSLAEAVEPERVERFVAAAAA
ncbi:MAG TPA: exonuclease domain-containing protein, partial [Thermoleophilaceae bacterium]|nr:exonuclease domain-containing protein [Thermoleophilaceae bacterium]